MKWDYIPEQDHYLYTEKWDAVRDQHLLRHLLAVKDEVYPTLPHKSPPVLADVLEKFNDDLQTKMRLLDFHQRLEFLERRFNSFKTLMMTPGCQWDGSTNQIITQDEVWEKIFEDNWLAQAYLRAGEPEFNEMCMLFAPDDVKPELSHTLVLISDYPKAKKNTTVIMIDSSPEAEEVNSLVPPPPKPVVRKLTYAPDDAMSSIAPTRRVTPHYYVPWPKLESRLRKPTDNEAQAHGVHSVAKDGADKSNIGGDSSCASSSPFK